MKHGGKSNIVSRMYNLATLCMSESVVIYYNILEESGGNKIHTK